MLLFQELYQLDQCDQEIQPQIGCLKRVIHIARVCSMRCPLECRMCTSLRKPASGKYLIPPLKAMMASTLWCMPCQCTGLVTPSHRRSCHAVSLKPAMGWLLESSAIAAKGPQPIKSSARSMTMEPAIMREEQAALSCCLPQVGQSADWAALNANTAVQLQLSTHPMDDSCGQQPISSLSAILACPAAIDAADPSQLPPLLHWSAASAAQPCSPYPSCRHVAICQAMSGAVKPSSSDAPCCFCLAALERSHSCTAPQPAQPTARKAAVTTNVACGP